MIWESTVLNIMQGGPRHNEIVETHVLATSHTMGWIVDYVWTPEILEGSQTGRQARVWRYREVTMDAA